MKFKNVIATVLFIVSGFSTTLVSAQQANQKKFIKKAAKEACTCTDGISSTIGKEEVVEQLNSCITAAIIKQQLYSTFNDLKDIKKLIKDVKVSVKDGDTTFVVGDDTEKVIIADKNFREIQDYMMKNCKGLKNLVASNDMLSDKSLSANPEAMKVYHEGEDYFKKQKLEKAAEKFKAAVKLDPEFAFAWDNLGLTYRYMGNYDEALKCYRKSLEVDPYGTMPLQNIAIVYEYKKDYKQAAAAYDKVIEAEPDNPEGYYGAGRAYYFAEDYEKGCDYMFKAYKLYGELKSPYMGDAEKNLGAFWNDLKEKGKENIFNDAAKANGVEIK
ncbi:tetratricopeptide repeat protein [Flavobacterium sp. RHBU_24]|uniref:tetratricopeptide repeat protein n=1 Tax=Flavobacterium sp. RHBU_24 TaxID=3391185 RepID=UPI003984E287